MQPSATCQRQLHNRTHAAMKGLTVSYLLTFYGFLLLWVSKTESTNPSPSTSTSGDVTAAPVASTSRVSRPMVEKCNSSMEAQCIHGECMFRVDLKEHYCKCSPGHHGPRCAFISPVTRPMSQEMVMVTVVCVALTVVGFVGMAYFLYSWYKKKAAPTGQKEYQEVQMA
ncbi:hypothetical protein GJAV_G00026810 [Gymnothorax javanicus]|nr:hypothetical protein GJAV_G00026810 [Gymnothorax javanicus]